MKGILLRILIVSVIVAGMGLAVPVRAIPGRTVLPVGVSATQAAGPATTPSSDARAQACTTFIIQEGTDDAEEVTGSGVMYLSYGSLDTTRKIGTVWTAMRWGLRFRGVTVPRNATITSAYLTVRSVYENASPGPMIALKCSDVDNAATFTTTNMDISGRSYQDMKVDWSLPDMVLDGSYVSPDLTPILQPLVSRAGWESGNAVVLSLDTAGRPLKQIQTYENAGSSPPSLDICYEYDASTIGDYVWVDMDADGVQDAGEPGKAGVAVALATASTGTTVATTTTDSAGLYSFSGVAAGDYYVRFTLPAGYTFTVWNAGSDDAADSDARVYDGRTANFSKVANVSQNTWDAGLLAYVSGSKAITTTSSDTCYEEYQVSLTLNGVTDGTITVPATSLTLTDIVAEGFQIVPGSWNVTPTSLVGNTLTWEWDSLAVGATSFTYRVRKAYPVATSGDYAVSASISLAYTDYLSTAATLDLLASSNPAAYLTGECTGSDLATTKYSPASFPTAGQTFAYSIDVKNNGSTSVSEFFFTDDLPEALTFVEAATTDAGATVTCYPAPYPAVAGGMVSCTYSGAVTVGGTAHILLAVRSSVEGPVTNTGCAVLASGNDGTTANNCDESGTPTLAVLSGFSAFTQDGQVIVQWETAFESKTAGYFLYRQDVDGGAPVQVNAGIVPAFLGTTAGGTYRLLDPGALPGVTYTYRLQEIEAGGQMRWYGPFTVAAVRPATETFSAGAGVTYERVVHPAALEMQPAQPEPNTGTEVPEALPGLPDLAGARALEQSLDPFPYRRYLPMIRGGSGTPASPRVAKLTVRASGLYYLAGEDIATALGISMGAVETLIGSTGLQLTNQDQPVAYLPASGNAGLYFYAEGLVSPFTRDNVYWLKQAGGTQMETLASAVPAAMALTTFTTTVHAEQDLVPALGAFNDPAADYWMWDIVVAADPQYGSRSFAVRTDGAAGQGSADLVVQFLGVTDSGAGADHHARILVNGTAIGEAQWAGAGPYEVSLDLDPALLNDGANTVEVVGVLDAEVPYSIFFVDSHTISYQRTYTAVDDVQAFTSLDDMAATVYGFGSANVMVFDISDPKLPRQVTATSVEPFDGAYRVTFKPAAADVPYLALTTVSVPRITTLVADTASSLKGPNAADYVIVTTAGLEQSARALASYRQDQGLQTMVVDIQDAYDEFNGGVASPQALRDMLAYAYANWSPAPRYVLLAGAGSYDYRNILGYGDCLVPPILVGTLDILRPADGRYADVVGDNGLPEFAVGRLPVLSRAEFDAFVAKIQAYEAADPTGWSRQVLMLADNTDPAAGDFPADSGTLAADLPAEYAALPVYLGPLTAAEARSQTLNALAAGVGVFSYIGHAGMDTLASERLLTSADVAGLSNGPRLPFISAATCTMGSYDTPGYRSLGVRLALQGDGGAAAVFAATGSSLNPDGVALVTHLFRALFDSANVRAGDATREALTEFAAAGGPRYALDTYNLLGDPAMEVAWR